MAKNVNKSVDQGSMDQTVRRHVAASILTMFVIQSEAVYVRIMSMGDNVTLLELRTNRLVLCLEDQ